MSSQLGTHENDLLRTKELKLALEMVTLPEWFDRVETAISDYGRACVDLDHAPATARPALLLRRGAACARIWAEIELQFVRCACGAVLSRPLCHHCDNDA